MRFRVTKRNLITSEERDYGKLDQKSLKEVLKGYKESKNWFGFYERKNSNWVYIVEPVDFN